MNILTITLIIIFALIIGAILGYFWIMHKINKLGEAIEKAIPPEESIEAEKESFER